MNRMRTKMMINKIGTIIMNRIIVNVENRIKVIRKIMREKIK